MPECQNCGTFVTAAYARVFTPNGVEKPRVCPQCEDKIRDGADVREARSTRRG
jgi:NAD-dependent SIR2 family protein deacetylase